MKKLSGTLPLVALVALIPFGATADGSLVRFDGGIGVDPVSGIVANAPALNVVRGVPPGAFPWVIKRLRADVFERVGHPEEGGYRSDISASDAACVHGQGGAPEEGRKPARRSVVPSVPAVIRGPKPT